MLSRDSATSNWRCVTQRSTSLLNALRHKFPMLCCCIAAVGLGKETCLICGDSENKNFHFCSTPGCHFGYCSDCWQDIEVSDRDHWVVAVNVTSLH